eukprot:COSAG01_NODE_11466_length_1928_cov_3.286495_1_plen_77_part_00
MIIYQRVFMLTYACYTHGEPQEGVLARSSGRFLRRWVPLMWMLLAHFLQEKWVTLAEQHSCEHTFIITTRYSIFSA